MSMIINVETVSGLENIDLETINIEGFCKLLSKMSVDLELPYNAKTLLYSGYVSGTSTLDVVKNIEGVRLIRDTALGKFMESEDAILIIEAAIRNELNKGTFDINMVKSQFDSENYKKYAELVNNYNELSLGKKADLQDVLTSAYLYEASNGAWAIASKEFIKKIPEKSEVVCICPEAAIDTDNMRIWAAAEIPEALELVLCQDLVQNKMRGSAS